MDEPAPNYPIGNRRTKLEMPEPFVVLTAAGYFAIPTEAGTILIPVITDAASPSTFRSAEGETRGDLLWPFVLIGQGL